MDPGGELETQRNLPVPNETEFWPLLPSKSAISTRKSFNFFWRRSLMSWRETGERSLARTANSLNCSICEPPTLKDPGLPAW